MRPTSQRRRIAEAWDEYASTILSPKGVPSDSVQYIETRRAFYQGAIGIFSAIMRSMDHSSQEPTEADLKIMDDLADETGEFAAALAMGRM